VTKKVNVVLNIIFISVLSKTEKVKAGRLLIEIGIMNV